jgi:hypothetical protein
MTAYVQTEERPLNLDTWFSNFMDMVSTYKAMYKDKTMPKDLASLYNTLMVGTQNEVAFQSKNLTQAHFVPTIISKYLELIESNFPQQLAFAHNDNEILVWAELKDDDWTTESALILAAAKVNAEFHKFGYDITTTFVEECDNLSIPNHYKPIILQ